VNNKILILFILKGDALEDDEIEENGIYEEEEEKENPESPTTKDSSLNIVSSPTSPLEDINQLSPSHLRDEIRDLASKMRVLKREKDHIFQQLGEVRRSLKLLEQTEDVALIPHTIDLRNQEGEMSDKVMGMDREIEEVAGRRSALLKRQSELRKSEKRKSMSPTSQSPHNGSPGLKVSRKISSKAPPKPTAGMVKIRSSRAGGSKLMKGRKKRSMRTADPKSLNRLHKIIDPLVNEGGSEDTKNILDTSDSGEISNF